MTDAPYCNFYVGQKVVCAPKNPLRPWHSYKEIGLNVPVVGEIYTIRSIYLDPVDPVIGVLLMEVVNDPIQTQGGIREVGWVHHEFKPVTDISVFKKALEKA